MLHDTYRPKRFEQLVGQDALVKRLRRIESRDEGFAAHAYWISGKSGAGKTTIARIIAATVSDTLNTREYDARQLKITDLDAIQEECAYMPMGVRARCIIVNEAHRLRADHVTRLLNLLEAPLLNEGICWILTTTLDGDLLFDEAQLDGTPLKSRCIELTLAQRGLSRVFAEHCRGIAQAEKLDGRSIEDYIRLAKDCRNNLREMIGRIEAGVMIGE